MMKFHMSCGKIESNKCEFHMIENGEYMSKYVENKDGYIVFGSGDANVFRVAKENNNG